MLRPVSRVVVISLFSLGAANVAGCASSVSGDVDGEKVPSLLSAFFVQRKQDAPDPANGGQLVERFAKSAAYGGDESLRFRIALSRPGCHSERSEESSSS